MPINRDPSTPPPLIGKIGPYTVFMTPPSTPQPSTAAVESPKKVAAPPPPPVKPPPQQYDNSLASAKHVSNGSVSGFFWHALSKVQNAHSSLDEHLARWFGLNQSKYQWALDDYYETNRIMEKEDVKAKEMSSKV